MDREPWLHALQEALDVPTGARHGEHLLIVAFLGVTGGDHDQPASQVQRLGRWLAVGAALTRFRARACVSRAPLLLAQPQGHQPDWHRTLITEREAQRHGADPTNRCMALCEPSEEVEAVAQVVKEGEGWAEARTRASACWSLTYAMRSGEPVIASLTIPSPVCTSKRFPLSPT